MCMWVWIFLFRGDCLICKSLIFDSSGAGGKKGCRNEWREMEGDG